MLIVTKSNEHTLIAQYLIMEVIDRTWRYSDEFRNEYFSEKEDAYEAIVTRGSSTRRYAVVETCVVVRMDLSLSDTTFNQF